jgi:hypothetical protein
MKRGFFSTIAIAVGVGVGALAGCGSSSVSAAGDGGGGNEAGIDADADARAPDDPRRPAADAACSERATAYCARLDACFHAELARVYGDASRCEARQKLSCTPAVLAAGSATTPDDVRACASALAGATCDDLFVVHRAPAACHAKAGSLANDASCGFDAQCASSHCYGAGAALVGCGHCAPRASDGGACANANDCDDGLVCAKTARCRAPLDIGGTCSDDAPCKATSLCLQGKCIAWLGEGDVCDGSADTCDRSRALWCNFVAHRCEAAKPLIGGSDCALVASGPPGAAYCTASSACAEKTPNAFTCLTAASDGAACDRNKGPLCMPPAFCDRGTCNVITESSCR